MKTHINVHFLLPIFWNFWLKYAKHVIGNPAAGSVPFRCPSLLNASTQKLQQLNGIQPQVILRINTCAFPTVTCQKCLHVKGPWGLSLSMSSSHLPAFTTLQLSQVYGLWLVELLRSVCACAIVQQGLAEIPHKSLVWLPLRPTFLLILVPSVLHKSLSWLLKPRRYEVFCSLLIYHIAGEDMQTQISLHF